MVGDDAGAETGTDSRQRFAADLRRLRLEAGNPTLSRLQDETGISRTVLSEAFAGRQLPSARTIDGIVRACDADAGAWLDRRDALAELLRSRENGDTDAAVTDAGTESVSAGSCGRPEPAATHCRVARGGGVRGRVAAERVGGCAGDVEHVCRSARCGE